MLGLGLRTSKEWVLLKPCRMYFYHHSFIATNHSSTAGMKSATLLDQCPPCLRKQVLVLNNRVPFGGLKAWAGVRELRESQPAGNMLGILFIGLVLGCNKWCHHMSEKAYIWSHQKGLLKWQPPPLKWPFNLPVNRSSPALKSRSNTTGLKRSILGTDRVGLECISLCDMWLLGNRSHQTTPQVVQVMIQFPVWSRPKSYFNSTPTSGNAV